MTSPCHASVHQPMFQQNSTKLSIQKTCINWQTKRLRNFSFSILKKFLISNQLNTNPSKADNLSVLSIFTNFLNFDHQIIEISFNMEAFYCKKKEKSKHCKCLIDSGVWNKTIVESHFCVVTITTKRVLANQHKDPLLDHDKTIVCSRYGGAKKPCLAGF